MADRLRASTIMLLRCGVADEILAVPFGGHGWWWLGGVAPEIEGDEVVLGEVIPFPAPIRRLDGGASEDEWTR